MWLSLKILLLLWLINFAPPLLAHFLESKWNTPLDGGRSFRDGKPLLGPHKTQRGVVAAVLIGLVAGLALKFPWWVGLLAGVLSMAGDLSSSFIKRRQGKPSGGIVPGLDQGLEGIFPFLVLGPYYTLSGWTVVALVSVFSAGAFLGSYFFKAVLLMKPSDNYRRPVRPSVRLRELRSCQITSSSLRYLLNFEDCFVYHFFMSAVFRLLGIYEKGKRNALEVKPNRLTLEFADLPPSFDDYTIMFLSDLHLDGLEGLTERLQTILKQERADLCILGGDFRMETYGPFDGALRELRRLVPDVQARDGIVGVLGNHDCIEIVDPLEAEGITFLINESKAIEREQDRIWIVGVDDPHYYRCHNLELAFSKVPPQSFTIFVAHSNEVYEQASKYAPQLYLCGHSHAGQIQLPHIGPVFTHSRAPRRFCQGQWRHGSMRGYTSNGAGVSGVPVRFASQGEVVLLTLKRQQGTSV